MELSVQKIMKLAITSDMRSDLLSLRPLHITTPLQANKKRKYQCFQNLQ